MKKQIAALFRRSTGGGPFPMQKEWDLLTKGTIARYARGNIAAQRKRIQLPHEQEQEHATARGIARRWRERAQRS
jgi:hypothetical protein